MLSDITFGQFFPAQSLLHKMDPRMKLVLVFVYIILVFVAGNPLSLGVVALFLAVMVAFSDIPVGMILKSVKPIIPIVIFTSLLNMFYVEGEVLIRLWKLTVTKEGLILSAFIAVRIALVVIGSSLLTYTTTPTALTDGLERLLKPLTIFHIKVHELAMMMTIALRFIPTLMEETDKIMSAQKARGADLESGGLVRRARALVPILIPLLVSSFRRAYELATAMECRCYRGGEGRTRMKKLMLSAVDFVAALLFVALIVCVVVLNLMMKAVV